MTVIRVPSDKCAVMGTKDHLEYQQVNPEPITREEAITLTLDELATGQWESLYAIDGDGEQFIVVHAM